MGAHTHTHTHTHTLTYSQIHTHRLFKNKKTHFPRSEISSYVYGSTLERFQRQHRKTDTILNRTELKWIGLHYICKVITVLKWVLHVEICNLLAIVVNQTYFMDEGIR